jgi:hypothetical protein
VTPVGDVGNVSDSSADEAIAQDSASDDEQKSMRGKKDD